jgi:phenylalanyl-tRNA synthetase alpha chain
MHNDIESIKDSFLKDLSTCTSLKNLSDIRVKYLGKKGLITQQFRELSSLPADERPRWGKTLNEIKRFIDEEIKKREASLKDEELQKSLLSEKIDITVPGCRIPFGHAHPVSKVIDSLIEIFVSLGFSVEDGPEVELDYYNFESLNFPKDHPARDMQDTFFISDDVVLRTHTSSVQVRVMEKYKPPLRVIVPGKVYRCDADISHIPMFHQLEGFVVDRDIRMSDLKGVLELFIHRLFGRDTRLRFRPSFFPFTEPSAEVDISCVICKGSGCSVCGQTGWIEILGAGMINPKVYEYAGYDPDAYTGFAFGLGIERVAMLLYGIDDIRLFPENDIRFLRQF